MQCCVKAQPVLFRVGETPNMHIEDQRCVAELAIRVDRRMKIGKAALQGLAIWRDRWV